ncbi:hypothetical protein ARSEF1564_008403 [Beauveria bassiana]
MPRRTASWQGQLQPPMWDTPRKRTAPWEDILAAGKADPLSEDETLVLDR